MTPRWHIDVTGCCKAYRAKLLFYTATGCIVTIENVGQTEALARQMVMAAAAEMNTDLLPEKERK